MFSQNQGNVFSLHPLHLVSCFFSGFQFGGKVEVGGDFFGREIQKFRKWRFFRLMSYFSFLAWALPNIFLRADFVGLPRPSATQFFRMRSLPVARPLILYQNSKQGRLNLASLQGKQRLFAVQTACVAGQFAITADNAVTGNQDRHLVLPVCSGNGADGFRITQLLRLLLVAARFRRRNSQQRIPYLLLKGRAYRFQRRRKNFQTALEV